MTFNVSSFRSIVNETGVLRKNRFRIRFNMPMGMMNNVEGDLQDNMAIVRDMEMWAAGASIPTVGLMTTQVPRYGYGSFEERPYNKMFAQSMVSFMVDGYAEKWKFFDKWLNMIFSTDMSEGINGYTSSIGMGFLGTQGAQVYQPYQLAYKDEYITDVVIDVFNALEEVVLSYVLREAFPVRMSGFDLNWADNNSIARLDVAFAYTDAFRNI